MYLVFEFEYKITKRIFEFYVTIVLVQRDRLKLLTKTNYSYILIPNYIYSKSTITRIDVETDETVENSLSCAAYKFRIQYGI